MAQPTNDGNIVKRTSQYLDNLEHDETTGGKGVAIYGSPDGSSVYRLKVNSDGSINATTSGGTTSYLTKIDTATTSNVIYIGKAALTGSAVSTASAVWQIKKLDTSSLALDKKYADGDDQFNNIWDNRASLTYN